MKYVCRVELMSGEEIELPRASYELLTNIIKGFLAAHGDETSISTKKIASYVGRHHTLVSQNIKAITFFGIASREKGYTYKLTRKGADLAYSIEYNDQEGTAAAFRSLISENEFLKSLVFSVKSHGSISNSELRDEIGKRAKVTKRDARATTGAQTVIDILKASGLVREEDDNIVTTERVEELLKGVYEFRERIPVVGKPKPSAPTKRPTIPMVAGEIPMQIQVRLDFQVPLHPEESDIKSIANTIRKIRNSLAHKVKEEEE